MITIHIETSDFNNKEFQSYLKRNDIEVRETSDQAFYGGVVYSYTGSKISIKGMIEVYFDNMLNYNI